MAKYIHKFDTENAFNTAYNGEDYAEPWVSYTNETEGQEHVDYNKVIPFFQTFWTEIGNTGRMPDKVLFNYGSQEPGYGGNACEENYRNNQNPLNINSWSIIDDCISGGVFKVLDANEVEESDLREMTDGHYYYFLWELTENGWPEGFNGGSGDYKDGMYGYYYDGTYYNNRTNVMMCLKIDGVWYGGGIYGD